MSSNLVHPYNEGTGAPGAGGEATHRIESSLAALNAFITGGKATQAHRIYSMRLYYDHNYVTIICGRFHQ